jgi:hypothetical protein
VSGAPLTAADQPTKAPRSHVRPFSLGDKRRATVLRKVRTGGIVADHDWQPAPPIGIMASARRSARPSRKDASNWCW